MSNDPIRYYGYAVNPDELEDSDDGIEAILPDDKVVMVTSWLRIRAGAAGTGEGTTSSETWEWKFIRQAAQGTYKLVKSLPAAVKKEVARREQAKKPFKRFLQQVQFLGSQCMDDDELVSDILEMGVDEWLQSQK